MKLWHWLNERLIELMLCGLRRKRRAEYYHERIKAVIMANAKDGILNRDGP